MGSYDYCGSLRVDDYVSLQHLRLVAPYHEYLFCVEPSPTNLRINTPDRGTPETKLGSFKI